MKKMLKKAAIFIFALTMIVSGFGVFAEGEAKELINDPDDILTAQTEAYIEKYLAEIGEDFGTTAYFEAVSDSNVPTMVSGERGEGAMLFRWTDSSEHIALYRGSGRVGLDDTEREVEKYAKNVADKQEQIKDAFSFYVVRFYGYNEDKTLPEGMMIGGMSAEEFFEKKSGLPATLIGIGIVLGVVAVIVIIAMVNKTPKGSIDPNGSNFKKGFGSGSAAFKGAEGMSAKNPFTGRF